VVIYCGTLMARSIDKIEIKDPPIQELQKKRSCLWRSCTTGAGCILLFLIGSAVIIKLAITPKVKELSAVPDRVQGEIPLYDLENVDTVKFTAGADRQKALSRAAAIPNLLLSPIITNLDEQANLDQVVDSSSTAGIQLNWRLIQRLLQPAAADERDVVQIEWRDLSVTPAFIQEWYKTELKKKQFTVTESGEGAVQQFTFRKKDIDGSISFKDDPKIPGTEYVLLTAYVPAQ